MIRSPKKRKVTDMTSEKDDLSKKSTEELLQMMDTLASKLGLPMTEEEAELQMCHRFEDDMDTESTAKLFERYESEDLNEFEFREIMKSFPLTTTDEQIFKSMKSIYPNTQPHHLYVLIQRCLSEV
jgi:hypothetical protein